VMDARRSAIVGCMAYLSVSYPRADPSRCSGSQRAGIQPGG
jgi:hypothetical protein